MVEAMRAALSEMNKAQLCTRRERPSLSEPVPPLISPR